MTRLEWELAGMTDGQGRLDRPVAYTELWVPDTVRLVEHAGGEWLEWQWPATALPRRAPSGQELLTRFVALAAAPAERIRQFAARWGVLGLCAGHKGPDRNDVDPTTMLPGSHDPAVIWCPSAPSAAGAGGCELLARWRDFAAAARSVLNVAARLRVGQPVQAGDWEGVWPPWVELAGERPTSRQRWNVMGQVVDYWLRMARVRFGARGRDGGGVQAVVGGGGLFGALAVQLLVAVSGAGGLLICEECGLPFVPRRRYQKYCKDCGIRAAWRRASASYRLRRRP
jgi:hypothetical protein